MIIQPSRDLSIIRPDGIASDQFQGWVDSVTALLNTLEPIQGAGSPEGVVYADKWRRYENTTGSAGTLEYIKSTDASLNTGWVAFV